MLFAFSRFAGISNPGIQMSIRPMVRCRNIKQNGVGGLQITADASLDSAIKKPGVHEENLETVRKPSELPADAE